MGATSVCALALAALIQLDMRAAPPPTITTTTSANRQSHRAGQANEYCTGRSGRLMEPAEFEPAKVHLRADAQMQICRRPTGAPAGQVQVQRRHAY